MGAFESFWPPTLLEWVSISRTPQGSSTSGLPETWTVQQLGRVGRSGEPSHAFLLYSGRQLRKVESIVLQYIKGDKCRRQVVMSAYMATEAGGSIDKHDCCDVCHAQCQCAGTSCSVSEQPAYTCSSQTADPERNIFRQSTQEDRDLLLQSLENLRVSVMGNLEHTEVVSADLTHGITKSVIE